MADDWDFYYCHVDDAPASILLNFAYRDGHPAGIDALYLVGLQILHAGENGLGVEPDTSALWPLEDAIVDVLSAAGFTYVGRVRTAGDWQLTFYGAPGRDAELERLVEPKLARAGRGYRFGGKADDAWSYYDDFMFPDPERWQWILDRRVVQQLVKRGDAPELPRPVDHFVDFEEAGRRDAYLVAATKLGFEAVRGNSDAAKRAFTAELTRVDRVELEHIHDVVMQLKELAEHHGGTYGGWGSPVTTRSA